jgi:hypothetical protein
MAASLADLDAASLADLDHVSWRSRASSFSPA